MFFLGISASIFDAFIVYFFFKELLGRKHRSPSIIYYSAYIIMEVFLMSLGIIFEGDFSTPRMFAVTGSSFLFLGIIAAMHRCRVRNMILAVISFQIYACIAEAAIYFLFTVLPDDISYILLNGVGYGLIGSKIFLSFLINVTVLICSKKKKQADSVYTLLVLIMPVLSLIILITIPGSDKLTETQALISSIGMAGILFANIANYYLIERLVYINDLKQNNIRLENQLVFQAEKYRQISASYRTSQSIIHDIKKHFLYIQNSIKLNELDGLSHYMSDSINELENAYSIINTGNLVIDSLVSNYMAIASHENIKFDTDINIVKENIEISDYDLCIILGNLLDNALNACRKLAPHAEKKIIIHMATFEHHFLIDITNTYSKANANDSKDNLLHGYGTVNVEKTTNKNLGTYVVYEEGDCYRATVSLPINLPANLKPIQ